MFFLKILWGYLLIVVVLCRDPPTVKIPEQGTIMGMFMKMYRTQRIVAYMGIPYAQPPIGMLRFQAPDTENLPSWEPNVRNGSIMQADCYQNVNIPKPKHSVVFDKLINKVVDMDSMEIAADQYDEDCLYLNIFVPDGKYKKNIGKISSIYNPSLNKNKLVFFFIFQHGNWY